MSNITQLQQLDDWVTSREIINTNINNLNTDKLDKITDTLDDIPVWVTNKHINQTQLNKIENWVMLTDTDCDTVTTWGRYWMIWTPVNWPQAWEFYLEVLSDWTRIMQVATYLDNTVWTRYYNWTVWSSWVFWKATWTNTWDQTSIVWITWTKAQFNTAVTDWAIVYEWDDITWNAWTATALQTARTINWVSFNWTANISVPSDITPWAVWNIMTSNWTIWTSAAPAWWGGWTQVSAYRLTSLSFWTFTETLITFNVETIDSLWEYDTSTWLFTATEAWTYFVTAMLTHRNSNFISMRIKKNSSIIAEPRNNNTWTQDGALYAWKLVELAIWDTIAVYWYGQSGTTTVLLWNNQTYLNIFKI